MLPLTGQCKKHEGRQRSLDRKGDSLEAHGVCGGGKKKRAVGGRKEYWEKGEERQRRVP